MSINQLKKDIKEDEGFILSSGTHRYDSLLSKAYDVINFYNIKTSIADDIVSLFKVDDELDMSLSAKVFYGEASIKEVYMDDATYIWANDLFYLFNQIAPNGYYFGSSDGDGALFGWFKVESDFE